MCFTFFVANFPIFFQILDKKSKMITKSDPNRRSKLKEQKEMISQHEPQAHYKIPSFMKQNAK